jgi:type IV secretory pathway TraG/TraD family ATPase VirD4
MMYSVDREAVSGTGRLVWTLVRVVALGFAALTALGLVFKVTGIDHAAVRHVTSSVVTAGIAAMIVCLLIGVPPSLYRRMLGLTQARAEREEPAHDPLREVREVAWRAGGGVYLGLARSGEPRFGRGERATLLLGPPRSGKTSGVIIPAVLAHTGPVVSTSTKPDVARATRPIRARGGQMWLFDPTGAIRATGDEELRWSPITASQSWDGALLIARAMCSNIGTGTTDRSYWASRAQALLAPLLHAAAN